MTVLNSNFEDWRRANPDADIDTFPFSPKKLNPAGSLFDYAKLIDVSKNVISRMSAERDMQARRRRANLIMIFTMFSACAKIAEVFLQPRYGWVWLIQFALSMVVYSSTVC